MPAMASVLPKPLEPVGRQLRVAHGVLDVLVPQVVLEGPGVVAVVGELVATGPCATTKGSRLFPVKFSRKSFGTLRGNQTH